jgi:hypothetical protein
MAQQSVNEKPPVSWFVSPHYGFVIPHKPELRNIITGRAYSIETSVEWLMTGKKQWHYDYGHPSLGIDFHYSDLGNPKNLGQQISLSAFVKMPFNKQKGFAHSFELGSGVGYATVVWDLEDNLKGVMIGSHFNTSIFLQYNAVIPIGKSLEIRSGLRVHHLSNGAMILPNLGTNNVSVFVGLGGGGSTQKRNELLPTLDSHRQESFSKYFTHSLFYGLGKKAILPPGRKSYWTHTLSELSLFRISPKSSIGLGLDLFYNTAVKELIIRNEDYAPSNSDVIQLGVAVGYALHFDKVELDIVVGTYLRNKYKGSGAVYNRWGLKYHLTEHLYGVLMLKSHLAKADHPELGIGWRF